MGNERVIESDERVIWREDSWKAWTPFKRTDNLENESVSALKRPVAVFCKNINRETGGRGRQNKQKIWKSLEKDNFNS